MKTYVLVVLFFCFWNANIWAMEREDSELEKLIGLPDWNPGATPSILFVYVPDDDELKFAPPAPSEVFVAPVHPEVSQAGSACIKPPVMHMQPRSGYQSVVPSIPLRRNYVVARNLSNRGLCSSWCVGCVPPCSRDRCKQACGHFPFGWFLCCCCCMDRQGRPIPIKKCLHCCFGRSGAQDLNAYPICEYLTCGGAALITIATLATAGIIG